MKIAVIGSRGVSRINFELVGAKPGDVIVTGGARGVDSLAEVEALEAGFDVVVFIPEYGKFGRAAPHVRNRQVVDASDRVVAFWDGTSRGTKGTIDYARRRGKPVDVVAV